MPWLPELFSAPVLEDIQTRRLRDHLRSVPFFDGLLSGELDALRGSFAGEPELHHPVHGRVKGARAFERFVTDTQAWLADRNATVEDVAVTMDSTRGVEEVLVHLDGYDGRVALPLALAGERDEDDRIVEMRIYFSTWPLTGGHATRPPLLQPDPDLRAPDIVVEYQRALAEGDADAAVAAFEPDASVQVPLGAAFAGTDDLRTLYTWLFSNGGGIPLEHCTVTDDGRACALEYNLVRWGRTELQPQAGIAVYVRGPSGRLAAARIYDDADPPMQRQASQ